MGSLKCVIHGVLDPRIGWLTSRTRIRPLTGQFPDFGYRKTLKERARAFITFSQAKTPAFIQGPAE